MKNNLYIECAKIVNTHGCYGAVKLESWCNTPEECAQLKKIYFFDGKEYSEHRIVKASVYKQFVIATLADVQSMDKAISLKGTVVYALRSDFNLSDGEYFIADLNDLPVIDANTGRKYGRIKEVINRGASDIYVVNTPNGERMIPVVDEFVSRVDISEGIFVTPIEGMLD
jgi:16S rRNA processing protein RimM